MASRSAPCPRCSDKRAELPACEEPSKLRRAFCCLVSPIEINRVLNLPTYTYPPKLYDLHLCQPRSRGGCRPGASRRIRAHLII